MLDADENTITDAVLESFAAGSPYLESDAVFGVKRSLIQPYERKGPGPAPDGAVMDAPWRHLRYDFGLKCSLGCRTQMPPRVMDPARRIEGPPRVSSWP